MIIGVSGKINSGKDLVGSIIQWIVANKEFPDLSFKTFQEYEFIEDKEISNWKIVKWADKLKDMVCILLSCTREQLEDRVFKETVLSEEWWYYKCGNLFDGYELYNYKNENYEDLVTLYNKSNVELIKPAPRLLMQLLGTECGRQIIHPNIWVNATLNNYDYIQRWIDVGSKAILPNWIITDTRFPNEADAVKSRGGINIRLIRNLKKCTCLNDLEYSNCNKNCERHRIETEHESETALDNYTFDYIIDNNGTIEDLIIKVKEILIKENII